MRYARPQALSDDGLRLIVETDDGEQIAILADAQLRQLLRGDRPRPQLEIEMDTGLTPREIQTRIRAGASVEELADASGMPTTRIEAFAGAVLAEREHIAGLAQNGSVRRRGEQAGHRTLQGAIAERLRERSVDPESVAWDAFKLDDGRWSISAGYRIDQSERQAVFYFDSRGRFSVTGNDEARWMVGEQTNDPEAASPTDTEDLDAEPTLKLAGDADELALLRSVETGTTLAGTASSADAPIDAGTTTRTTDAEPDLETAGPSDHTVDDPTDDTTDEDVAADDADPDTAVADTALPDDAAQPDEAHGAASEESAPPAEVAEPSQLDLLFDILGGDGYAEDSIRVFEGLSDAAAVPDVADGAWESQLEEDVPAEPEPESPSPAADGNESIGETADAGSGPGPADRSASASVADESEPVNGSHRSGAEQDDLPAVADFPRPAPERDTTERDTTERDKTEPDTTREPDRTTGADKPAQSEDQPADPTLVADEATQDALPGADANGESAEKSRPKSKKRKRASVPSWDEIMFGSPKGK